jgi:hypothetical protein
MDVWMYEVKYIGYIAVRGWWLVVCSWHASACVLVAVTNRDVGLNLLSRMLLISS